MNNFLKQNFTDRTDFNIAKGIFSESFFSVGETFTEEMSNFPITGMLAKGA